MRERWTGKMEMYRGGWRFWATVRGIPGYGSWWTFWSHRTSNPHRTWPFYHGHYFQRGSYDRADAMEHFKAWIPKAERTDDQG